MEVIQVKLNDVVLLFLVLHQVSQSINKRASDFTKKIPFHAFIQAVPSLSDFRQHLQK